MVRMCCGGGGGGGGGGGEDEDQGEMRKEEEANICYYACIVVHLYKCSFIFCHAANELYISPLSLCLLFH